MEEKNKKVENKYLSKHEFDELEKALLEDIQIDYTSRYIILFSMYTGARFGECLGMTWDCVDLENKTIKIEKGFDYHFTNDFTEGKTKSSKRKITIPDKLVEILSSLPIPEELTQRVFKRVSNNAINKALKLALARAEIDKDITFHAMRHTHASILLANGVQLLSVSKRLGHADPNITLHTYAHIIEELEREDNNKLNSIFN